MRVREATLSKPCAPHVVAGDYTGQTPGTSEERTSDSSTRLKLRRMIKTSDDRDLPFYLSDASFWMPRHIVASAWHQNAPFAFWIVDALRPSSFVELGTHNGFSYLCFCQAVDALEVGTQCSAVDTWEGDEHSGFYGQEVLDQLRRNHDSAYGRFSRLVASTFDDAAEHFDDESIDLLHIDGRHFYEDAKHDFDTWIPNLSRKSVVLLHDINVKERGFGVDRLWAGLKEQYPTFTFRDEHGLGVVGVGADQVATLSRLFEADDDPQLGSEIRKVYQRLGMAVTATARIDELDARQEESRARSQAELQESQARFTAELQESQAQIESYQILRTEQLASIANMQSLLENFSASATEERSALADENTRLNRESVKLAAELESSDSANRDLLAQMRARQDALHALQDALHALQDEFDALQDDSDNLRRDLNAIYGSRAWRFITRVRRVRRS